VGADLGLAVLDDRLLGYHVVDRRAVHELVALRARRDEQGLLKPPLKVSGKNCFGR